tara:strand:+ start:3407 stop:5182 length:1776 start_codon:yes stop_codon:yes gene_type:complete
MKYPKEYLDEIKTRLKVSNVISKSVKLKKRGKEFIGLSPFKTEKTPSFTVNDEKGFYHCFSTGEHGNIFDFLMKTQNLKFGEAVKTLANFAGMRPYIFSKEDEHRENKFKEYISAFNDYIDICHNNILKNNNEIILNYLKKRNLSLDIIKKFKLGFNLDNKDIYKKLKIKHGESTLKDTGLFYYDEKNNKFVEKFRNRLIFPIFNITNNPIGIGGRIIENKKYLAKYINSPETPFFKKGSNLFNLNFVRTLSNKIETVYIVEGYMDVIGMSKNGINNVVANLGTALTEKQILILNQFFDSIIICFDGDRGGNDAAIRAAENSIINLQTDKKIFFLFLPEGEDPDSFVTKNKKEKFEMYSRDNLISIHEFIYKIYRKSSDNSPSSLATLEKKLRKVAYSIKDEFIRKYTLEYFLKQLDEFTPNTNKINNKKFNNNLKSLNSTQNFFNESKNISAIEIKEFSFLCVILKNLNYFSKNTHLIEDTNLFTKENSLILEKIKIELKKNSTEITLDEFNIDNLLLEKIFKFASVKYLLDTSDDNDQKILDLLEEIKRDFKNFELELRIDELESKFAKDFNENTFNELKELKKLQKIN